MSITKDSVVFLILACLSHSFICLVESSKFEYSYKLVHSPVLMKPINNRMICSRLCLISPFLKQCNFV